MIAGQAQFFPNIVPFGLDSAEYNKSVDAMDSMVGYVMEKLDEFKLKDLLNVIVLSDHGMVNLFETNQTILIEPDLIDMLDLNKTVFAMPHAHIYPLEDSYVKII